MAGVVGRTIPIEGVQLISPEKEMQVILGVRNVATVEHHRSSLPEIKGSAALDQVLTHKTPSIGVTRFKVLEDVDERATYRRSGHVLSDSVAWTVTGWPEIE